MKNGFRTILLFIVVSFLAACGGGSSNSGGPKVVYAGSETITISVPALPGYPPQTSTFPLTIEITGNAVRIIDVDGVVYRGTINAGAFTATGTIPTINFDGIACKSFSITYKGKEISAGELLPKTSKIDLVCGNGTIPGSPSEEEENNDEGTPEGN